MFTVCLCRSVEIFWAFFIRSSWVLEWLSYTRSFLKPWLFDLSGKATLTLPDRKLRAAVHQRLRSWRIKKELLVTTAVCSKNQCGRWLIEAEGKYELSYGVGVLKGFSPHQHGFLKASKAQSWSSLSHQNGFTRSSHLRSYHLEPGADSVWQVCLLVSTDLEGWLLVSTDLEGWSLLHWFCAFIPSHKMAAKSQIIPPMFQHVPAEREKECMVGVFGRASLNLLFPNELQSQVSALQA